MYSKQILKGDEIDIEYCGHSFTGVVIKKHIYGLSEVIEFCNKENKDDRYKLDVMDEGLKILARRRAPNLVHPKTGKQNFFIDVNVIGETGWEFALYGISQNKNQPMNNMPKVAELLAHAGSGHSKFLESMMVYVQVTAPRYWWQEADTYRLSTKQSQSTMFTTSFKNGLDQNDFESPIDKDFLDRLNELAKNREDLVELKSNLPEGYLQQRVWCFSYKTLQNIYNQRKNHTLPHWRVFCSEMLKQIEHKEYIIKKED